MTTSPRHRDVHLVLPDAAHEQVVVTDGGALPRRRVQLAAGESTAQAVRRDLMADADLPDVAILDLLFDEREFDLNDDGRPLRALALLGPAPAGWAPPAGWRWRRAEEAMGGGSADPVTGMPPARSPTVIRSSPVTRSMAGAPGATVSTVTGRDASSNGSTHTSWAGR